MSEKFLSEFRHLRRNAGPHAKPRFLLGTAFNIFRISFLQICFLSKSNSDENSSNVGIRDPFNGHPTSPFFNIYCMKEKRRFWCSSDQNLWTIVGSLIPPLDKISSKIDFDKSVKMKIKKCEKFADVGENRFFRMREPFFRYKLRSSKRKHSLIFYSASIFCYYLIIFSVEHPLIYIHSDCSYISISFMFSFCRAVER